MTEAYIKTVEGIVGEIRGKIYFEQATREQLLERLDYLLVYLKAGVDLVEKERT